MRAFVSFPSTTPSYYYRVTTTCRAKRDGGKRTTGGTGFGKPKPAQPNKRARIPEDGDISDFTPRAPQSTEMPDPEVLRAEFAKRGIEPPKDFSFNASTETSSDDDYTTPSDGTMPEVVASRMGRRIAIFGGIPFSLLFAFFATYFVLTYKFEIRVIPAVVAYSTLSLIGASGVGITYGIFSSSWDPEDEGSALGFTEAKKNLFRARDAVMGQRRREKQDDEFDRIDRLVARKEREDE